MRITNQKEANFIREKSAILQIYYGERGNFDTKEPSDNYFELLDKLIEKETRLKGELKNLPEAMEIYRQFCKINHDMTVFCEDLSYCEGFRFGVSSVSMLPVFKPSKE